MNNYTFVRSALAVVTLYALRAFFRTDDVLIGTVWLVVSAQGVTALLDPRGVRP